MKTYVPMRIGTCLSDAKANAKLPKAVIVVNLYGQSAKMDELLKYVVNMVFPS
ncbi:hypothetical protein GCM10009001_24650 [Virgibacillus siamensis]|uniref:Uncharacterized protein n=1 Tax=Virgibacillus siamensis TaxID=480071 RepID=A0ABP3RGG8_9BACI